MAKKKKPIKTKVSTFSEEEGPVNPPPKPPK